MGEPSVDNLFPAIAQSFVVILIGYGFGFFNLISPNQSRAIGTLVGKLFLPALLFKNLALLNLSSVSWVFLSGMLVSKFSVFLVVAILAAILTRPFNVGVAGLFGIFATQSNDFAIGLPIVSAVYGDSHTGPEQFDYVSYIYLMAIVSLAIINPIGFLLMEYNNQAQKSSGRLSVAQAVLLLLRVVKEVVLNPIVFMTVLGLVVNAIVFFGVNHGEGKAAENLPDWLTGFLDILGGAYSACALFNIGLFMVGKLKKVTGTLLLVATLLIIAKTIILPFIAYRVVYSMFPAGFYNATDDDVSTFAFLMGTFPTAPTVFVYANQYGLAMETVATSLVLCTLFSAPIMYVSARMVLVVSFTDETYNDVIDDSRRDVSIVTIISVVFVFVLFLCARRYRSFLHVFVMHLMVAMLIEVVGVDILQLVTDQHLVYWEFFYFSIFFVGVLSTRTWMAATAIGLLVLVTKGPARAERAWIPLMILSWGIPVLITVLLVGISAATQSATHKQLVDISFLLGKSQLIVSLAVLLVTFTIGLISVLFIILYQRAKNKRARVSKMKMREQSKHSHGNTKPTNTSLNSNTVSMSSTSRYGATASQENRDSAISPSIDFDSPQGPEVTEQSPLMERSVSPEPEAESSDLFFPRYTSGLSEKDKSGGHIIRFIVLIIFLLLSTFIGVLMVIWKLSSPVPTGIFVAVNILDTITNIGQGFFVLAVFGFEKHWFWVSIYSKLRKLLFRVETVVLPREDEIEVSVLDLCKNFRETYKELCVGDIVTEKTYLLKRYKRVFSGVELVDWLVGKGVVRTREEAVQYGHSLLVGRVIKHVSQEHYFHDDSYFYRFVEKKE